MADFDVLFGGMTKAGMIPKILLFKARWLPI
jgi:hypothetical protein